MGCQLHLTILPQLLPQTALKSMAETARVTSPLLSSAKWHDNFSQAGAWLGAMARQNKTYSCCKDIPRASASHIANQPGSLPSDSCPRTNTAGTWLYRKGSHVSPLRGSLIHAKRYSSLDLKSGIHLSFLTPRFCSSFPVLSPRASAVWAHHT